MAHFAELDENDIVLRVIVVNNNELDDNGVESEAKGISFCEQLLGGRCRRLADVGDGARHQREEQDEDEDRQRQVDRDQLALAGHQEAHALGIGGIGSRVARLVGGGGDVSHLQTPAATSCAANRSSWTEWPR